MRIGIDTQKDSPDLIKRLLPLTMEEDGGKGDVRYLYMNAAQRLAYNFGSRQTAVRAGRGIGKTTAMLTPRYVNCVQTIPRAEGLFLGNSIKQLYTKTVPAVVQSLEANYGWQEGVHFFRGHAPKKLGFAEPLRKPRVWENVIHSYNGNCCYLISMAITASANGFNAAYLLSDESRFLPWKKVLEEVIPALRGGVYDHPGWSEKSNPYYLSSMFVSDAALTVKQSEWERHMEGDQTEEVNQKIAEMLAELSIVPELAENEKFLKKLNGLRSQSRVFFNFSSIENVDILGERYIAEQKRLLPELMFAIQILGQRKGIAKDGYYSNFDIDIHGYLPSESSQTEAVYSKFSKKFVTYVKTGSNRERLEYEAPDLNSTSKIADCSLDTDIDYDKPLEIAFDYGANTNYVVTGQPQRMDGIDSLLILSSMYVRNERKLRALCGDWCRYYEPFRQRNEHVRFYYDATARQGGNYAVEGAEDTKYYNVVREELTRRGWKVEVIPMGRPMLHSQKYQFVNDALVGRQKPFLRINRENNEYLIIAMENARVKMGRNGPEKDKSDEKLKSEEGRGGAYQERTDITDALDTLWIGNRYYGKTNMYFSMPKMG